MRTKNNSQPSFSVCCVSGNVLKALNIFTHLVLKTSLRYYYYLPFKDKEAVEVK